MTVLLTLALTVSRLHVKLKCLATFGHIDSPRVECSTEAEMRSGVDLIQAFAVGAGFSVGLFLLLALYLRMGRQIRHWFATFKMKSLFWRNRRRRKAGLKRHE